MLAFILPEVIIPPPAATECHFFHENAGELRIIVLRTRKTGWEKKLAKTHTNDLTLSDR